jgi:hypothetical protein
MKFKWPYIFLIVSLLFIGYQNCSTNPPGNDYTPAEKSAAAELPSEEAPAPVTMAPPRIISAPISKKVTIGDAFDLSVVAEGISLKFAWFQNDQPITGATQNTFIQNQARAEHSGVYKVVVSNEGGSVSRFIGLTVEANPQSSAPSIALDGHLKSVVATATNFGRYILFSPSIIRFEVKASSPTPVTYQWFFTDASGVKKSLSNLSNLPTYNVPINSVSFNYKNFEGTYHVEVSNANGRVSSSANLKFQNP